MNHYPRARCNEAENEVSHFDIIDGQQFSARLSHSLRVQSRKHLFAIAKINIDILTINFCSLFMPDIPIAKFGKMDDVLYYVMSVMIIRESN